MRRPAKKKPTRVASLAAQHISPKNTKNSTRLATEAAHFVQLASKSEFDYIQEREYRSNSLLIWTTFLLLFYSIFKKTKNKKRRATREQLKGVSRVRFFFISSRRSAMLFFIIAFTQTGRVETHSTARPPI
jgi:hypothetical protein